MIWARRKQLVQKKRDKGESVSRNNFALNTEQGLSRESGFAGRKRGFGDVNIDMWIQWCSSIDFWDRLNSLFYILKSCTSFASVSRSSTMT